MENSVKSSPCLPPWSSRLRTQILHSGRISPTPQTSGRIWMGWGWLLVCDSESCGGAIKAWKLWQNLIVKADNHTVSWISDFKVKNSVERGKTHKQHFPWDCSLCLRTSPCENIYLVTNQWPAALNSVGNKTWANTQIMYLLNTKTCIWHECWPEINLAHSAPLLPLCPRPVVGNRAGCPEALKRCLSKGDRQPQRPLNEAHCSRGQRGGKRRILLVA